MQKQIAELTELLLKYSDAYYNKNAPLVSDLEYDTLYHKLLELERTYPELALPNSPTKKIGAIIEKQSGFSITHEIAMYSLDNSYNEEDIRSFASRLYDLFGKQLRFSIEPKMDGAAVSITYSNGKLALAASRGDGKVGEDITLNALYFTNLPKEIDFKEKLTIRGEVVIKREDFEELNRTRSKMNLPLFANPRNAASGSLKLLDMQEVKNRRLSFFAYNLAEGGKKSSHYEDLQFLKSLGIPTSEYIFQATSIEEIISSLKKIEEMRFSLSYDIDGAVIKLDNKGLQQQAGFTAKYPRWAIAYKYEAQQARTKLLDVTFQVGRTGALTPVAILSPTLLSGSTISRATLHNEDEIARLGIKINDMVFIEKGGEVIPKVVAVIAEERTQEARDIIFPTTCPECGSELTIIEGEAKRYCSNRSCPAILKGSLIHFASRDCMDIVGMGEKVIEELFNAEVIKNIEDIYSLTYESLHGRAGWKKTSINNLLNAIENSKLVTFDKVLFALGFRHIGAGAARLITERFKSIDALKEASFSDLTSIVGIGVESANSLIDAFRDSAVLERIEALRRAGLQLELKENKASDSLQGKTFLITGTLSKPRKYFEDIILNNGGKLLSAVSKNLDFLIVGENAGSKLQKAEALGINILTEENFLDMVKL